MLKAYIQLTKPGIVRANVMTAAAAFLYASAGTFDWLKFAALVIGTALVVACGCVLNNIMDLPLDKKMKRTKKRPLVTGKISVEAARKFAYVIGIIGLVMLVVFTNWLTAALGVLAVVFYVYIYGWAKRHTIFATSIGTIPGGASIVAGYTAVTGRIDAAAFTLFLLMVTWQMAHFLAITLFRSEEYEAARISVLPQRRGKVTTQKRIMLYMLSYCIAGVLFMIFGGAGMLNSLVIIGSGMLWLYAGLERYQQIEPEDWGRKMFGYSLIILLIFCAAITLDGLLS